MSTEGPNYDGELAARISNTVVRALSRTTGRGPTKAKTTLGANGVFVCMQHDGCRCRRQDDGRSA